MASILSIETATTLCSVALSMDGKIVSEREIYEEKSHAAQLTVFIEELLKEQSLKVHNLDAIAVGKGPGSYTGLRIGVSTAKGLCFGAHKPLIAINTLRILFQQAVTNPTPVVRQALSIPDTLLCPMIDARRMEVFTCLFNVKGAEIEPTSARIIDNNSYKHTLSNQRILFFGSGMEKSRKELEHQNAIFVPDVFPKAVSLALLAEEKYARKEFEDLAYFEPFYLKDFVATVSKKGLTV